MNSSDQIEWERKQDEQVVNALRAAYRYMQPDRTITGPHNHLSRNEHMINSGEFDALKAQVRAALFALGAKP